MIRAIYGIAARAGVSPQEFRSFWDGHDYRAIIEEFVQVYRIERLERHLCLQVELSRLIFERQGIHNRPDALIEAYWPSAAHVQEVNDSPAAENLKRRWALVEEAIVDRERSFFSFVADH